MNKLFFFLHAFRSPVVNHGFILLAFTFEHIFLTGQCLSYRLTNVFMNYHNYAILTSVEPMTSSQFCSSSSFFSASTQFLSVCLMGVCF